MNDVVLFQEQRLSATQIRAHVDLVKEVMAGLMKKDIHYGTIPGTQKPTLFKPGAELLAATFRIAVSYVIEDLSGREFARYRVTATGTHQITGITLGAGIGECSSLEEKFKWRKAYDQEFNATQEDRRRLKYGKYIVKQVLAEHADLANTVLKMACKRAQVAMTLSVTAASDIFAQDIEDLPEELRPQVGSPKQTATQPYPEEQFAKNLPAWSRLIQSGKKTAAQIITTVSSKAVLSEEQKRQINFAGGTSAIKPAAMDQTGQPDPAFVADMEQPNRQFGEE